MTRLDARMRVGLRIKELRGERGVSQEAFANSIGMSRTYFAEVEIGKRNISIDNIARICDGFGSSIREFFDSDLFQDDSD
ncbi:helix-turn-helix transcriptional regulator [Enorma massiliensis]|uniref:helix-turn-helix domain-containing protein n=1 Tax=Enorma massiliensis TaxID=1472761 RepID=UPI002E79F024|nr:helix-turn-helix transcriptional regulator [Enorma massiliensis]